MRTKEDVMSTLGAYQQHIAELNHDNIYERVCDLEDEVKKLKEDMEKLNN